MPDPDFDPEEFRKERIWWFRWTFHFDWFWNRWIKKLLRRKKDEKNI
jgi:hypothetical protein